MAKFCINCGTRVQEDWNVCPECGTLIYKKSTTRTHSSTEQVSQSKIPRTVEAKPVIPKVKTKPEFSKYLWGLSLIGGIICLIGLVTPAAYYQYIEYGFIVTGSISVYLFGFADVYQFGYGHYTFWTEDPIELTISIISTILILVSGIIIIVSSVKLKNLERNYLAVNLTFGILLIIAAASYMIAFEVYSILSGYGSYWSTFSPGFALIGSFISGVLVIISYFLIKKYHEF